jgi:phage tail sheath protein FI
VGDTDGRVILVAPGMHAFDSAAQADVTLPGTYTAAAVAGLLSTLVPQSSPTNKSLPGVQKLSQRFTYGEEKTLVGHPAGVLVLDPTGGARVIRGVSTDTGAFKQITTRRITDYAKAGMRAVSNPFIGKLNNARVRKALNGAINGFLSAMVADEALISYDLAVTATRADEIAGRAIVNAILRPTFSIDFVAVTLTLE